MVDYIDEEFPHVSGYGMRGGPNMSIAASESPDSGVQQRADRWPSCRWEYELETGLKDLTAFIDTTYRHFLAVGKKNAFPFLDRNDFTSRADGRSSPTQSGTLDQVIGVGDSTNGTDGTATFQLRKTYTFGARDYIRNIRKPMPSGRVTTGDWTTTLGPKVSVAGTLKTESTHFTVNYSTGEITFTAGNVPTAGQVIRASFEFRVPVMYAADFAFKVQRDEKTGARVLDLRLTEDPAQGALTPEFPPLGGGDTITFGTSIFYDYSWGASVFLDATAASLAITLPDINDLPFGGPYFWFYNLGGNSITFKNRAGTNEFTLPINTAAMVMVQRDTGDVRKWRAA